MSSPLSFPALYISNPQSHCQPHSSPPAGLVLPLCLLYVGLQGPSLPPLPHPLCQISAPGGISYKGRGRPSGYTLSGKQVGYPYSPSGPPLLIPQSHAQLRTRLLAGTCPASVSTPVDSRKSQADPAFLLPAEPSQSPHSSPSPFPNT